MQDSRGIMCPGCLHGQEEGRAFLENEATNCLLEGAIMPDMEEGSKSSTQKRYADLIAISQDAFAERQLDAAYHALVAAMYSAREIGDAVRLTYVSRMATQQLAGIDENQPTYPHSTFSAAQKGLSSVYALLARQASTSATIIQTKTGQPGHRKRKQTRSPEE